MYGAGLPVLLFLILAAWGLKEEELTWLQVGICFVILALSYGAISLTDAKLVFLLVPTVIIDIWLMYKLDILSARVR